MTLDENIRKELEDARKHANDGKVAGMEHSLQLAISYAERVGTDISGDASGIRALLPE